MGVNVRVAGDNDDDIAISAALRRAWCEENAGSPIDDDAFDAGFELWWRAEQSTRTFFIVEVDGVAVGMANVKHYVRMPVAGRPSGGWWGYLGQLFVLPEHRNDGVGAVMMKELTTWAWAAGAEHIRLAPSPRSWPFYTRLGFTPGAVVELNPPS